MSSQVPPYLALSLNSRRALIERPHNLQEAIKRAREVFPEISQSERLSFITRDLPVDVAGGGEVEVAPSAWKFLAVDPSFKEVTVQRNTSFKLKEVTTPKNASSSSSSTVTPILNPQPSEQSRPQTLHLGEADTEIRTPKTTKPALGQAIKQKIQGLLGTRQLAKRIRLMIGKRELQDGPPPIKNDSLQEGSSRLSVIPSSSIHIFVRTVMGTLMTFDVKATKTVAYLKARIQDKEGIPPDQQRLVFSGKELEDDRTLRDSNVTDNSSINLVLKLRGGKPVIYLFPPSPLEGAIVDLSLVPQWRFSALYPTATIEVTADDFQKIRWQVDAGTDGTMLDHATKSEISYLFWEAEAELKPGLLHTPTSSRPASPSAVLEQFDPSSPKIDPSNSVVLSRSAFIPYLDKALKALSLHTEARTSFITFWLPSFLRHSHIALRFLPQKHYSKAAPLSVTPTPDVITRIFMLFKGVKAGELQNWEEARKRAGEAVDMWKGVVGLEEDLAYDTEIFRVLEWGGMEVLL